MYMFIAMRTPGHYCAEPFNYAAKQRLVDRRLQLATLRVHRGNTRTLGLNMRCAIVLSCFLAIGSASTSSESQAKSAQVEVVQFAQAPAEYRRRPTRTYVNGQNAGDFQPYVDNCLGQL